MSPVQFINSKPGRLKDNILGGEVLLAPHAHQGVGGLDQRVASSISLNSAMALAAHWQILRRSWWLMDWGRTRAD